MVTRRPGDRSDVEAIKRAAMPPREVARVLGLLEGSQPQPNGWIKVRCPHGERTPSCSLTAGRDRTLAVHCFGGCGLDGDAFTLAAAAWGLDRVRDFHEIKVRLADAFGVDIERRGARTFAPPSTPVRPPPPPPPAEPPQLADDRFAAVVAPLLTLGRLDGSPYAADVEAYLESRHLLPQAREAGMFALPPVAWQSAIVGLLYQSAETSSDNGDQGKTDRDEERRAVRAADGLPEEGDEGGGTAGSYVPPFTAAELAASGLFRGRGFLWSEHRLCIPWRDPPGEPKYVVPSGRHAAAWPFGIERVAEAPPDAPVLFVEGELDALALRSLLVAWGEPGLVLGLGSLGWWRPEWAALARGRAAVVAVDADAAGDRNVQEIAADLRAAGAVDVKRWKPPAPAKDWADAWAAYAAGRIAA